MRFIVIFLLVFSSLSYAGGWSNRATPTQIDVERGNGFMVYGDFGNPGACTATDRVYVSVNHPQYDKAYATVLAAFMSGKKIQVYSHVCEPVTWYSSKTVTYNIVNHGALNISH